MERVTILKHNCPSCSVLIVILVNYYNLTLYVFSFVSVRDSFADVETEITLGRSRTSALGIDMCEQIPHASVRSVYSLHTSHTFS